MTRDEFNRLNIRDVYGERGHYCILIPEHPSKRITRRLARRRLRRNDRKNFINFLIR